MFMQSDQNSILYFIFILAITIGVFLLIREVVCWYFKINERVRIQKITLETMLKLYEQNGGNVDWDEANRIIK